MLSPDSRLLAAALGLSMQVNMMPRHPVRGIAVL